jgi:hypothetical protein
MVRTVLWAGRIQAALGFPPQSVQEALEGLRAILRKDEVAKAEFFQAAREGWRFERFSRTDRVALIVWAALKEALQKTAKHLGQEKAPSNLVVRKDDTVKEEVRGVRSVGDWKSPEGRIYEVYPWDLKPKPAIKGTRVRNPQWGDRRVAESKAWLQRFLASGEEVRAVSRLEREQEGDSPHFSEPIVSSEVIERLEKVGFRPNLGSPEELALLVDKLPTREARFMELVSEALAKESDAKAQDILGQILALGSEFSVNDVSRFLRKLTLSQSTMRALTTSLQEVAALRGLKVELHRAGYAPVRAVAYRDLNGEVIYTAPIYG